METNNNNNGGFELPRAVGGTIIYKVSIGLGDLYENMAKWERMELQRCTRFAQNVEVPEVERLESYFKTLTWVRVTQATNPKAVKDYKKVVHSARIPNRLATILENIGEAHDRESNIKFIPVCEICAESLMSVSEMMEISDLMGSYLQDGYNTVTGMEKGNLGSVMLMSKLVVSEPDEIKKVLSYRKDNPVYAFFAAVLQLEIVDLTYQDLFRQYRVRYTDVEQYGYNYHQFYRDVANTPSVVAE